MPLAPGYTVANLLHLLLLHLKVDVHGYDLARLTIWQVDLREANLPQVDLSGADLSGALFLEPFEIMRGLAVSPDGRLLATGATNGEIYVWASADQQIQRIFKGHTGPVYSLAFSPDGQRLATASGDRTTRLWDLSTGELYCTLRGHTDEVVCVRFDANGEAVLTLSYDGTVMGCAQPGLCGDA